jgi:hypothetical protein
VSATALQTCGHHLTCALRTIRRSVLPPRPRPASNALVTCNMQFGNQRARRLVHATGRVRQRVWRSFVKRHTNQASAAFCDRSCSTASAWRSFHLMGGWLAEHLYLWVAQWVILQLYQASRRTAARCGWFICYSSRTHFPLKRERSCRLRAISFLRRRCAEQRYFDRSSCRRWGMSVHATHLPRLTALYANTAG